MPTTDTTSTNFSGALAEVRDEFMAMPASSLRTINLDIPAMAMAMMGILPEVVALRAEIVELLGERFASPIDRLPVYVQAVAQADAEYGIGFVPARLQEMSGEVVAMRELLLAEVNAHIKRKHVDAFVIAELDGVVGFNNQVADLLKLVSIFREYWATLAPVTRVTLAELSSAEELADRFVRAVGARDQGPASIAARGDLRVRAYSKAIDVYDDIRRVVVFLRWKHGDADQLVPSLWAGRGGRRGEEPTTPAVTPSAPSPAVAGPVVPAPAAPPIAPGLPGASPFITR